MTDRELGFILGLIIGINIIGLSSIIEYFKIKIRLKKYNRRLTFFNFLFKYYEVIHTLKSLDENAYSIKAFENLKQIINEEFKGLTYAMGENLDFSDEEDIRHYDNLKAKAEILEKIIRHIERY